MLLHGFHGLKILNMYNTLMKTVKSKVKNPDIVLIKKAFQFASHAHEDQKRLSGEPYFIHPISVAQYLAEMGLDSATIAAALLHDVVEDTRWNEEDIIREFGDEVNTLVRAVTKISIVKKETASRDPSYSRLKELEAQENVRLMLMATAKDVRVILIKLADKLHNMKTLEFQKPHKIERIANEVLKIYAPIAGRLGMFRLKSDLEDLAFMHLNPEKYREIQDQLQQSRGDLEDFINKISKIIRQRLSEISIDASVKGRAKHIYSIYNKMQSQGKSLESIYDLRGIRVIVDEMKDCYGALGIVHTLWPPISGRFKDYIATPKINGYQSLHTTLVGPDGKPLEVQIRTREMDEMADHGIAAHWLYKGESASTTSEKVRTKWLSRLSSMIEQTDDTGSFMEDLSHELAPEEVYVFTPKGDIIDIPVGGTVLDFAFRVHTDVGLRCKGARVNDRMVPLRTELKSGDRIEIITDKNPNPSPNWLRYIKSQRARQKLRAYFRSKEEEEALKEGRSNSSGVPSKNNREPAPAAGTPAAEKIRGDKKVPAKHSEEQDKKGFEISDLEELRISRKKTPDPKQVEVAGARDIPVRYAQCCSPVPGDPIVGYITRGRGVTIHRKDCTLLPKESGEKQRLIPVRWEGLTEKYPVTIEVKAHDRQGLYMEMVGGISRTYTNILRAEADIPQSDEDLMVARFLIEVEHADHLQEIIESLMQIPSIISVTRTQMTDQPKLPSESAKKKKAAPKVKKTAAAG